VTIPAGQPAEPAGEPAGEPARAVGRRLAGVAVWRWATDPILPVLLLAPAAVLAAARVPVLTWAVLGGLAGYSLSGSV